MTDFFPQRHHDMEQSGSLFEVSFFQKKSNFSKLKTKVSDILWFVPNSHTREIIDSDFSKITTSCFVKMKPKPPFFLFPNRRRVKEKKNRKDKKEWERNTTCSG